MSVKLDNVRVRKVWRLGIFVTSTLDIPSSARRVANLSQKKDYGYTNTYVGTRCLTLLWMERKQWVRPISLAKAGAKEVELTKMPLDQGDQPNFVKQVQMEWLEICTYWFMIGIIRLYRKARRSRSSAMDGISFGSPPEVPELIRSMKKEE